MVGRAVPQTFICHFPMGTQFRKDNGTDIGLTVGRLIIACSIIAVNSSENFNRLFYTLITLLPFGKISPFS